MSKMGRYMPSRLRAKICELIMLCGVHHVPHVHYPVCRTAAWCVQRCNAGENHAYRTATHQPRSVPCNGVGGGTNFASWSHFLVSILGGSGGRDEQGGVRVGGSKERTARRASERATARDAPRYF